MTLGKVALEAEAGPRLKVLATLAPLDLQAGVGVNPNNGLARCTNLLILLGDNDALILGDVVALPPAAVALLGGVVETVPAAHDASSLGVIGSGTGGKFHVALLVLALPSRLHDEVRVVDDVLELGGLGVHHGGHVISLVALCSDLARRVVGIGCLDILFRSAIRGLSCRNCGESRTW